MSEERKRGRAPTGSPALQMTKRLKEEDHMAFPTPANLTPGLSGGPLSVPPNPDQLQHPSRFPRFASTPLTEEEKDMIPAEKRKAALEMSPEAVRAYLNFLQRPEAKMMSFDDDVLAETELDDGEAGEDLDDHEDVSEDSEDAIPHNAAVEIANKLGMKLASAVFDVSRKTIKRWVHTTRDVNGLGQQKATGRRPIFPPLQDQLYNEIAALLNVNVRVDPRWIKQRMEEFIYYYSGEHRVVSTGFVASFLKRYRLDLRTGTGHTWQFIEIPQGSAISPPVSSETALFSTAAAVNKRLEKLPPRPDLLPLLATRNSTQLHDAVSKLPGLPTAHDTFMHKLDSQITDSQQVFAQIQQLQRQFKRQQPKSDGMSGEYEGKDEMGQGIAPLGGVSDLPMIGTQSSSSDGPDGMSMDGLGDGEGDKETSASSGLGLVSDILCRLFQEVETMKGLQARTESNFASILQITQQLQQQYLALQQQQQIMIYVLAQNHQSLQQDQLLQQQQQQPQNPPSAQHPQHQHLAYLQQQHQLQQLQQQLQEMQSQGIPGAGIHGTPNLSHAMSGAAAAAAAAANASGASQRGATSLTNISSTIPANIAGQNAPLRERQIGALLNQHPNLRVFAAQLLVQQQQQQQTQQPTQPSQQPQPQHPSSSQSQSPTQPPTQTQP